MKITKFAQSCLLVEMPEPVNRTVLFDPGVMSEPLIDIDGLAFLDDIVITHGHADHFSIECIKKLVAKFPEVRIVATEEVVKQLVEAGITATTEPPTGMALFDSPHESVAPVYPQPQEIGVHYLDLLTHPGDSHSFTETKAVLALPVTAPWGSMIRAVNLGLELKPKYIIPIHDWHWSDAAREQSYQNLEKIFGEQSITFIKAVNREPFVLDV